MQKQQLTRYAPDGSLLYLCSKCNSYKNANEFPRKDRKRGYACAVCVEAARLSGTKVKSMLSCLKDSSWQPRNVREWEQAVWQHLKQHAKRQPRQAILKRIRKGTSFEIFEKELLSLLSSKDLSGIDYFWFVFRPQLLSESEIRRFVSLIVQYVTSLSGLEEIEGVDGALLFLKYGEVAAARQNAYEVIEFFEKDYTPPYLKKAAQALFAACSPNYLETTIRLMELTIEMVALKKPTIDKAEVIKAVLDDLQEIAITIAQKHVFTQ